MFKTFFLAIGTHTGEQFRILFSESLSNAQDHECVCWGRERDASPGGASEYNLGHFWRQNCPSWSEILPKFAENMNSYSQSVQNWPKYESVHHNSYVFSLENSEKPTHEFVCVFSRKPPNSNLKSVRAPVLPWTQARKRILCFGLSCSCLQNYPWNFCHECWPAVLLLNSYEAVFNDPQQLKAAF